MSQRHFSISTETSGEYKEKGSKFLAYAYPVCDEAEIRSRLETLRKQYHDARHHCYAFIIGTDRQSYRANDDGEPNHSAGDPILGQIRSYGLTNCLVVVVRYFGGTKLGVPGLVNAYRTAAADALDKIQRIELIKTRSGEFVFGYDQIGTVERWVEEFQLDVQARDFSSMCSLIFKIPEDNLATLKSRLTEFPSIKLDLLD